MDDTKLFGRLFVIDFDEVNTYSTVKNSKPYDQDHKIKCNLCTDELICKAISAVDFLDLPNLSASSSMFSNSVKTELHSEQSLSSIQNFFQNNVLKRNRLFNRV